MSFFDMDHLKKSIANLGENVLDMGANLQQNISPFAQRTRQQLHERIVGNADSTTLPAEYVETEKQYEEIAAANNDLVKILSVFEIEGNDYPPSLRDTVSATYKGLQERVTTLRTASSAQDVGNILIHGDGSVKEPRTLHYALGHAVEQLAETLSGVNKARVAPVYQDVGKAEETVGHAKIEQDATIGRANVVLKEMVSESQKSVNRARKQVTNTRLDLDVKRSKLRHAPQNAPNIGSLETEVDAAEEEFVTAIEEASALMRAAIDSNSNKTAESILVLVRAQREYARRSLESLDLLLPELESKVAAVRDYQLVDMNRGRETSSTTTESSAETTPQASSSAAPAEKPVSTEEPEQVNEKVEDQEVKIDNE